MGQGHDEVDTGHGTTGHSHTAGANARSLTVALAITGSYLLAELAGAYWFNSLALLSDAAHMFTDAAALAIALIAIKAGQRQADAKRTYGYRRFEIMAAAFNALLLFAVAGYVLWEGIQRLIDPEPVGSAGMFVVACFGLVANLISMRILSSGKDSSLNVKGAYLEVWADMLGSLGVIAAGALIYFTDWLWVDPVVAIGIGLWVLPRTWVLLRDTSNILMQGVPRGMDLEAIREAINGTPGVATTHDLHLWSIAGDDASLTAHIVLEEGADAEAVRESVAGLLESDFAIHHVTLQTETEPCGDNDELHA